jgi:hypothetical protein
MPTLDDPGVYQGRPPGGRWLHGAISLAGTVGLVNSALIAVGAGMGLRLAGTPMWVAVPSGVLVLAGAAIGHVGYVRRRTSVAAARIRAMVDQRHPSGGPVPAPRPAETSPI